MAEFINVMKEFNRMCEYGKRHPVAGYCGAHCPVGIACGFEKQNPALHIAMNEPEKFERAVMHWAAEHQEPVYPTWLEWLSEQGLIIKFKGKDKEISYGFDFTKASGNICEAVAKKHNIPPKEAT